jgi:hypothetical protein
MLATSDPEVASGSRRRLVHKLFKFGVNAVQNYYPQDVKDRNLKSR